MKRCPGCYQLFASKSAKRIYCSDACKMVYHRRHDWDGKYSPKKPVERFVEPEPVEVTYDEQSAVYNAWSEALE